MPKRFEWLVVDGIEEPDDVAFNLERVGHSQLAVEQTSDRLRDDRLAVPGRSVDEHRMCGADRRAHLIEDALAQHEMRERLAHAVRV